MTKYLATVVAGVLIAGAAVAAEGHGDHAKPTEEAKITPQATCPVMGGKVNKDLYVDHDGKRIYVCCKGCIAPVQKEFAKYAKKVEASGETVAKLQATCPVMGGQVNKDLHVDQDGKRVYVCCKGCIAPVQKDFAKYVEKAEAAGEVIADTPAAEAPSEGGHEEHNH